MLNDLRYAFRQLSKNPGFTVVAVLTLGLGIGATTAIFSLINCVLLEPLPYEQPGQLVHLWEMRPDGRSGDVSPGAFMDWREHSTSFEGVSSIRGAAANLTGTGQPERINGLRVSADYLSILRERLAVGRGFLPEEERLGGGEKVAVLSHGLWQRSFVGDTNLVGSQFSLMVRATSWWECCDQTPWPRSLRWIFCFRLAGNVNTAATIFGLLAGSSPALHPNMQEPNWLPSSSGCSSTIRSIRKNGR